MTTLDHQGGAGVIRGSFWETDGSRRQRVTWEGAELLWLVLKTEKARGQGVQAPLEAGKGEGGALPEPPEEPALPTPGC